MTMSAASAIRLSELNVLKYGNEVIPPWKIERDDKSWAVLWGLYTHSALVNEKHHLHFVPRPMERHLRVYLS